MMPVIASLCFLALVLKSFRRLESYKKLTGLHFQSRLIILDPGDNDILTSGKQSDVNLHQLLDDNQLLAHKNAIYTGDNKHHLMTLISFYLVIVAPEQPQLYPIHNDVESNPRHDMAC